MREQLLEWLICPACSECVNLSVAYQEGDEIVEGKLNCSCGKKYPIIGGVPRMLPDTLLKELSKLYPDYFYRNTEFLNNISMLSETENIEKKKRATMNRFGYEWTEFSDYHCDNFEQFIVPLPDGFLENKVGLDIGCGAGRHARQASNRGAEIIAIDLSQAVDSAQQNNIDNNRVHIVQADIYNLPFRKGKFDFIYSLGVLHHLPDPEKAYHTLLKFLRNGGALFVWLYAYSLRKKALEILRFISQRLSNRNIQRMAFMCNLVDYGIFINLFKLVKTFPVLSKYIGQYAPLRVKEYADFGYRVSYTDWFDRLSAPITNYYKEQEMQSWLKRSALNNTKLKQVGDSWWWLYGERDK